MNKLLFLLLLLLPLSLIGQVESQFNGTLNVFSGSRIGSTNTFTISGIFNSTTTSYTSSQSDTGDIVQVQSGARFYWLHIYSIASNAGGVITCNVRDSSSTLTTFPLGKWSIFRPTPNLRLPLSPDGETNASRSSTFNTLAMRVDEIQTAVASATNCEQTFTKASHGFRKGTPVFWNGSTYIRPTADSLVPDFVVVDSLTANTFKVANCGTYTTSLANGLYWFTSASPGYSLTADTTKVPLFQALNGKLILNPIVGFNLMSGGGSGDVTRDELADSTAAIRADFQNGIISELPLRDVDIDGATSSDLRIRDTRIQFDGKFKVGSDSSFTHNPSVDTTFIKGNTRVQAGNITVEKASGTPYLNILASATSGNQEAGIYLKSRGDFSPVIEFDATSPSGAGKLLPFYNYNTSTGGAQVFILGTENGQFGARSIGGFSIFDSLNTFRRFKVFSNGTSAFDSYGTGVKEASDLFKTQSNYITSFATDGTLLDLGIGSGLSIVGGNLIATAGAGSGITALTGDVTASGTGSVVATIANSVVTNTKIGTSAVDSTKIAPRSVNTSELIDGAITTAKIASAAVDSTKAANLALSNLNTLSGSVGQVPTITASGLKYRTPSGSGSSGIDTTARYLQKWKYLPNWAAKIGQDEGAKKAKSIMLIGDSWFDNTNYIPYYLNELLIRSNTLGGGMFQVQAGNNNATVTPVFTGTWAEVNMNTVYPTVVPGYNGYYKTSSTAGNTCQFATTAIALADVEKFTTANIFTLNNSAVFRVRVDGGSWTTVTTTSAGTLNTYSITGLALTSHTIDIELLSGTIVLYGGTYSKGNSTAVSVYNMGHSGSRSAEWKNLVRSTIWQDQVETMDADLAIIHLGLNDNGLGYGASNFKKDLDTIVTTLQTFFADSTDILLIAPVDDTSAYQSEPSVNFRNKVIEVANNRETAFISFWDIWQGSYNWARKQGLFTQPDGIHPAAPGARGLAFQLDQHINDGKRNVNGAGNTGSVQFVNSVQGLTASDSLRVLSSPMSLQIGTGGITNYQSRLVLQGNASSIKPLSILNIAGDVISQFGADGTFTINSGGSAINGIGITVTP